MQETRLLRMLKALLDIILATPDKSPQLCFSFSPRSVEQLYQVSQEANYLEHEPFHRMLRRAGAF